MRVELDGGEVIDLGTTEVTPTIGITDYSRRATDDFGITTVVPRGFSRRMSVKFLLATSAVDEVQRRFAALRAKPAQWVADDDIASLSIRGFYKDFSLDIPGPTVSFCTLTVEGLAETDSAPDPGGDPAPQGKPSTLKLLQPVPVTDAVLTTSSVAETDYPAWAGGTTYAQGARVIRAHRVWESIAGSNVGNDPSATPDKWLDAGPTNRWAMFDQSLGTATTATAQITLTLTPAETITGLSVLDTDAGLIRVQAPGYDRTQQRGGDHPAVASVLFLDLAVAAGQTITVTIVAGGGAGTPRTWNDGATWSDAGTWQDFNTGDASGPVAVGTLLIGKVVGLGLTEASPTAAITDYSRKDVDDFGEVTVVERAWAKRMSARAVIRSDAVDMVVARITAVRAQPALWIGDDGLDALTIYGFFKDFEIEVGQNVSNLSLSIEGLSKAAPAATGGLGSVAWPDVTDPTGTKPTDNADVTGDNTSKDTNAVGGKPATEVKGELAAAKARQDTLEQQTIPAINAAAAAASGRIDTAQALAGTAKTKADQALANIVSEATRLDQRIDTVSASGGYDDTNVRAEVHRVDTAAIGRDSALGDRVDTVTASVQTTDNNLRALVQTKETAAVDRENAISRRMDDLVASGGGGSDGVDTVARAEVQRVEQASISRDSALGTRVDTVSASIGPAVNAKAQEVTNAFTQADTALASRAATLEAASTASGTFQNANPRQSVWPDGQELPTGWAWWQKNGTVTRQARPGEGGWMAYMEANAADHGHYVPSVPLSAGWYVMEADVEFVAGGSWAGAGITLHGLYHLDFKSEPDTDGVTSASPSYARRRFSKLFQVGPNGSFPSGAGPYNVHAMTNWSQFGLVSKYIRWRFCGVRPASDGEIKAAKAIDTVLPALTARVVAAETATTDGRFATAQRAEQIAAEVFTGPNRNALLSARYDEVKTATTDGRFASASVVQTLQSDYNGTKATVTQQAGTIAGLGQRTAAYWQVQTVAGDNRALLRVVADANGGGGVQIGGDLLIDGNVLVNGSVVTNGLAFGAATGVLDAISTSRTIPTSATISAPADGLALTLPSPIGQRVRIDASTTALIPFGYVPPGNGSSPTVYFALWRLQNGTYTQLRPWEAGTVISFAQIRTKLDLPATGAGATYLIRYYFDPPYAGSLNIGEEQVIVTEIKR